MTESRSQKTFFKALGPGLLWAGAAIGVSHLVQSTRAGAQFGFSLLALILIANLFKYPAFSFGPRYAAATGTSLLEGYRRRGLHALLLYAVLTLGTMFTVQAVVTLVTAALASAVFGLSGTIGIVALSGILTAVCAALLLLGHYKWLDKIVKVVVVVLTLSTLTATILVLPKIPWGEMRFLPEKAAFTDLAQVAFVVALVGWMPSAFDISIWHSLWTLARRRETNYAPTVKESMIDFNIGYLGTVMLSLCFLTLGAGVFFLANREPSGTAGGFAAQVVSLYTEQLGEWSKPIIGLSAFTVMFSTTLTVVDGFPRAIACLVSRFKEAEVPDRPTSISQRVYWVSIWVLGIGSVVVIAIGTGSGGKAFKGLVDLATTLSFLTAPGLAILNHFSMVGSEVPAEHRPGRRMVWFSWAGIIFSTAFAAWFLYVRFLR